MLTAGVCLIHDNARPHFAHANIKLLEPFGWYVSTHPPYSPDLAPSDYHLLTEMKEELDKRGGGKFLHGGDFKAR